MTLQYLTLTDNQYVADCMPFFHDGVFRLFYLVFLGPEKQDSPREGSAVMVASVLALAFIGLALGAFIYYPSVYVNLLTNQLGVNLQ